MKIRLVALTLAASCGLMAAENPATQVDRGRQLFLQSAKGTACANCHSLEAAGTEVGPDLTRLGSVIGPRGLVITIQMSMTAYVQEIKLRSGRVFAGIQKRKDGDNLEIYDLSVTPPKLLKMSEKDVASMNPNTKWGHPPTTAGYTTAELADVIAYIKFVGTGAMKEVSEEDLQ